MTTQRPQPQATGAGKTTRMAMEGIEETKNFITAWDDARFTAEFTKYKARKGIFTREFIQQAKLDPDPENVGKHLDQLKKWRANALKGMSERTKQEASLDLQTSFETTRIQLQGIFQKKQVAEAQENLGIALDEYKHKALHPASIEEQKQSIIEAKSLLQRYEDTKLISPQEKERHWNEWQEEIRVGEIEQDIYNNPELFLEKEKKGKYIFRDAKERSDAKRTAKGLINRNEKLRRDFEKDERVNKRFEVIAKIANGETRPGGYPDIIREVFVDDYKLAEAIKKNIQKGGFTVEDLDKEANKAFVDLSKDIFTSESEEEISDFLADALTQNYKISRDRLAGLVWGAMKRADEIQNEGKDGFWSNLFTKTLNPNYMPINLITSILTRFQKERPDKSKANLIINEETKRETGYSYEDLEYTAKQYGMTVEEVKKALKAQEE